MSFYVSGAAISAHKNRLKTFRKHLVTTVFTSILLTAATAGAIAQEQPKYYNADGTRTNDFEAAKKSWRDDAEYNGNDVLKAFNADAAYAMGFTGEDTKLGVIDQPVYAAHSEFAGDGKMTFVKTEGTRLYTDPYIPVKAGDPFVADGRQFIDGYGGISSHGTHVAGIAAANRDGKGMMGVAFDTSIFAASNYDAGPEDGVVLGNDGAVYGAAWDAMINSGVSIITDSWGIGLSSSSWTYAEAYGQYQEIEQILGKPEGGAYNGAIKAAESGIVVEFSAGNDGGLEPDAFAGLAAFRPELEKNWLTTMSVVADAANPDGYSRSGFSSICGYSKYHCVAAPGSNINSGVPVGDITGLNPGDVIDDSKLTSGYEKLSGTSMAGPAATGAFMVLKQRFPYLSNGDVNEILKTTSTDLGEAGVDNVFGWGLINLDKAMDGPGQFLSRVEANLPGAYSGVNEEVWKNDISQAALDQRKVEDQQSIDDWEAKKISEGWESGITEASKEKIRQQVITDFPDSDFPAAIELVRDRYAKLDIVALPQNPPLTDEEYEAANAAFEAADAKMLADPAATALWNAFVATAPNTSIPRAPQFVDFKDTPEASAGTIRGTITDDRIAGALKEFIAYEALVPTLTKKLIDPNNYIGGLTKSGAGTLRLTGDSTYRGDTIINGGLLAVDGSLVSKAVINKSGTLGGDGSVGGITANNGGTVAPGNSVGTLTSNGDVTFNNNSVLHIEVNGSEADKLVVNGKTNLLGGIVMVTPEAKGEDKATAAQMRAALNNKTYTIVTSTGGITGEFKDVVPTYIFYDTTLAYDPTKIDLTIKRNELDLVDLAKTHNQRAVAKAVSDLGAGNNLYDTIETSTVFDSLTGTYQSLTGEIHATLDGVLIEDGHFISQAATERLRVAFDGVAVTPQATINPLAYGPDGKASGSEAFAAAAPADLAPALWAQAYGAWAHGDSDGNASGYSRDTGGFVTGLDGVIAETWRFGLLASYGNTSLHSGGAKADVDSYQVGVYAGTQWDALGLRLGATLGHHEIDTDRDVVLGGVETGQNASYDAKTVQVFGELGYRINTQYAALEPFAAARYTHLKTDSFQEDGGDGALSGLSGSSDVTTTTLGLRLSRQFVLSETTTLTARGMLGWNHAFGDVTPERELAFAGGAPFSIEGLPIAKNAFAVEAGFDVGIGKSTTLGLAYTGQFSGDTRDNAVKADLTVKF
ncbi:autotransporter domain-containing protein [Phyllobacterium sp. SB3]|uniref:autotransporter domain-containing protein n=1 Tax=Phyllobacterium sp. SB3 TaxID=3156073 RepID=UPI0032AE9420